MLHVRKIHTFLDQSTDFVKLQVAYRIDRQQLLKLHTE